MCAPPFADVAFAFVYALFAISPATNAAEWPLWDGSESVGSYALRVNLPHTKSVDLGKGMSVELTLIPAGQFEMGHYEPVKPEITVENAQMLVGGGGALALVLLAFWIFRRKKSGRFSFSLAWLLMFTAACGIMVGGVARWHQAPLEAARYESDKALYAKLCSDAKDVHSVTLSQPFYMSVFTVTQAQYDVVMGSNPSVNTGAQFPVENVSWNEAKAFCKKLTERLADKTLDARLPTEAEWEFACRGGTTTLFYSGHSDADLDAVAWYADNSGASTHPVGQKRPNRFGLYDMHGNVWQWCEDAYVETLGTNPVIDPLNKTGSQRALRGGTYCSPAKGCWSGYRGFFNPENRYYFNGFRVVFGFASQHK